MPSPRLSLACALFLSASVQLGCASEPTAPADARPRDAAAESTPDRTAETGTATGGTSGGGTNGGGGGIGMGSGGSGGSDGLEDAGLSPGSMDTGGESDPPDARADQGPTTGDAPSDALPPRPGDTATAETAIDAAAWAGCGAEAKTSPFIKGPSAGVTDADQTFRSLVVSPTDPNVVLVGSEGNGMFRTSNGGTTWTWLRAGLRYDNHTAYAETWDLAIAPSKPSRVYAAMTDSPGPLAGPYPSARGGLYRSDDVGDTWRQMGCGLPNAKTAAVWVDPGNADIVIAALEGGEPSFTGPLPMPYYPGGLWRSTNGGETFVALTLPAGHERNSYWRLTKRGGKFWTVGLDGRETPDKGLGFLSSADGLTFAALPMPFAGKTVGGWDVAGDGMTILASVRDTFQLQRSVDGGATFAVVGAIASANANGPVAISPHDQKVVLFASNQRIHRSEDSLASSQQVLEAPVFVEDIEFSSSDPNVVYAAVRGLRVYRSGDAGKTWALIANLRGDVIDKN